MFIITTLFYPAVTKFMASHWSPLAGLDGDVTVVDIDCEGEPANPQLRELVADARVEAMHEFLKETPHF